MTREDITNELVTLRDYWRYAISRFNAADLSYGHGTTTAGDDAAFLLLAARPLGEPVVQYGPFVMNTRDEIEQAIADYRNGQLI